MVEKMCMVFCNILKQSDEIKHSPSVIFIQEFRKQIVHLHEVAILEMNSLC